MLMLTRRNRQVIRKILIYCFSTVTTIYILAPYVWIFITSISTKAELLTVPTRFIPQHITLENYQVLLLGGEYGELKESFFAGVTTAVREFGAGMRNSIIVSSGTVALCLALGLPSAYAFSRFRFRGRDNTLSFIFFIQMIPYLSVIIPLYLTFWNFRLLDTWLCLILGYSIYELPFSIWIMKDFFNVVPVELEESAMVDGCSRLGAFFRVILPLSLPGIVTVVLITFLSAWSEFFMAVIFTSTLAAKPITVIMSEFGGRHAIDYGMMATGALTATLPTVILTLIFQKFIIKGLIAGAIKR